MDFRTHRPQRGFGHSERSLAKLAEDLTRFLTKAQRSLTYDTLHLSSRQRETLASLLVEFAEDLSHDLRDLAADASGSAGLLTVVRFFHTRLLFLAVFDSISRTSAEVRHGVC